jgi:hypothetical protein
MLVNQDVLITEPFDVRRPASDIGRVGSDLGRRKDCPDAHVRSPRRRTYYPLGWQAASNDTVVGDRTCMYVLSAWAQPKLQRALPKELIA